MKLYDFVLSEKEKGIKIKDIFNEPVFVCSMEAVDITKVRDIKPIQVMLTMGDCVASLFKSLFEKMENKNDSDYDWSFTMEEGLKRLIYVIKMQNIKVMTLEGEKSKIAYRGSFVKKDGITGKEDMTLAIFRTLEEANGYYENQKEVVKAQIQNKANMMVEEIKIKAMNTIESV